MTKIPAVSSNSFTSSMWWIEQLSIMSMERVAGINNLRLFNF